MKTVEENTRDLTEETNSAKELSSTLKKAAEEISLALNKLYQFRSFDNKEQQNDEDFKEAIESIRAINQSTRIIIENISAMTNRFAFMKKDEGNGIR